MRRTPPIIALVLSLLSAGWAAGAPTPGGATVVKLTIHPSAVTRPALKHQLLPPVTDQSPGDGVPMYFVAWQFLPDEPEFEPQLRRMEELLDVPVAELVRPQGGLPATRPSRGEEILGRFKTSFEIADVAARRDFAHWNIGLRERGFDTLLPHLNSFKTLSHARTLRARFDIARGDWPAAAQSIQTNLAMARHLNDQPVLVQALVQAGMVDRMLASAVRDWVAAPKSPNLYWALSTLPQPFVELRPVSQWEQAALQFTIPDIKQAMDGTLPPERWSASLRRLATFLPEDRIKPDIDAAVKQMTAAAHPRAKEHLRSTGLSKEAVDAMPVEQASGIFLLHQYRSYSDEIWKAWDLPYAQAVDVMNRTEQEVGRELKEGPVNPFLLVVPQISRARYNLSRLDRHIALLRTIEALRDHASRTGALPRSLDEITHLPLPLDPITNKPFQYTITDQTATLDVPAPGNREPTSGWRIELTLAR